MVAQPQQPQEKLTTAESGYLAALAKPSRAAPKPSVLAFSPAASSNSNSNIVSSSLSVTPRYFVRLVYNGRSLPLPGACGGNALCPLEDFRKLMSAAIPADFGAECGLTSAAAVRPGTPHLPPLPRDLYGQGAPVPASLVAVAGSLPRHSPPLGAAAAALSVQQADSDRAALHSSGEDVALDTIAADAKDYKEAALARKAAGAATSE